MKTVCEQAVLSFWALNGEFMITSSEEISGVMTCHPFIPLLLAEDEFGLLPQLPTTFIWWERIAISNHQRQERSSRLGFYPNSPFSPAPLGILPAARSSVCAYTWYVQHAGSFPCPCSESHKYLLGVSFLLSTKINR